MKKDSESVYLTTKDFLVTGESFALLYDEEKEMLLTSPQPNEADLPIYYKSEAYISHTDANKGIVATLYQWVKKYSLSKKLRLITGLNKGAGTLLDIGAGTGDFLKLAQDYSWMVSGVEVNKSARSLSEKKGIVLAETLKSVSGQQFDVVTLWHVLEHLPNLERTLTELEALVKPGGVLIIAVPNFKSFDASYYKEYWAAYDTPRHLWHFSRKAMRGLFSDSMKLIKSKPMIFDSFYVSLLSEKYKTGNAFSLRALLVGLWSNLSALGTKENSSLIYCFKKAK
ncbi:class I SAM-dependent methyltransferase [Altibacter sp.]|uniref:class I SAM-dependent methyltransferase n=1 Tax=Altibacter sp. TaxID=2024823 RepID=UPI0025C179A3|nr:class I SAM-dependent methyltransferase [Altibacter sp.]